VVPGAAVEAPLIAVLQLAAATAVATLLAFVVPALINLDRYRPRVVSYLQGKTGKQVEIGLLALRIFPLAIHIDNFGVKNPRLFPPGYIVKVPRIDAELDAGALLHRKLVIKSLVLENPVINLASDPDGPWNFENPQSSAAHSGFPLGLIAKLEITGGRGGIESCRSPRCAGPHLSRSPRHLVRVRAGEGGRNHRSFFLIDRWTGHPEVGPFALRLGRGD